MTLTNIKSSNIGNLTLSIRLRKEFGDFIGKNRSSSLQFKLDLHYNQRLYSLHELKEVINRSGWRFVKSFGSIEHLQQQASPDTQEIITVSKN